MSGHDCAERADRIVDSGPNDYSCRRRRGPEQEQKQQQQQPQRQRAAATSTTTTLSLWWAQRQKDDIILVMAGIRGSARARGHTRQLWQRLVRRWHQRHHHHNHFFFPFRACNLFRWQRFPLVLSVWLCLHSSLARFGLFTGRLSARTQAQAKITFPATYPTVFYILFFLLFVDCSSASFTRYVHNTLRIRGVVRSLPCCT